MPGMPAAMLSLAGNSKDATHYLLNKKYQIGRISAPEFVSGTGMRFILRKFNKEVIMVIEIRAEPFLKSDITTNN